MRICRGRPQILLQFCSWVALLLQGFINLLAPILLYRQALLMYPGEEDQLWRVWRRAQARRMAWLKAALGGRAPAWRGTVQVKHSRSFSEGLEMAPLQGVGEDGDGTPADALGARRGNMSSPVALPRKGHIDLYSIQQQHHSVHGVLPQGELHVTPPLPERARPPPSVYHVLSEEGPPDGPPEYRTRAVPAWLGADPLALATALAIFVSIAILVSIVLSLFL